MSGRTFRVNGVTTYTIGETARRSGFSASALRFYEDIGLVEPSGRTESGYRLYDDGALARLAFIARAKQLGCSLDEISDLADIWDGQRCGPVQRRFHDLLTAKIRDASVPSSTAAPSSTSLSRLTPPASPWRSALPNWPLR
jgi:DNA-binding transcriptional MerR regulator